jgi:elongation factor 1 alpha-like protein
LGVNQLVVAVNKLDTAGWSQVRFEDIRSKLQTFLVKLAGFRPDDITFVPCSGLLGENLATKSEEPKLSQWYTGPTLLEAIDSFRPPERPVGKPLRLTVNDVFKGPGGLCVAGRLETGMLQSGDKVLIQPIGEIATVKSITMDNDSGPIAFAGDPVLITLLGVADASVISIGFVLTDPSHPIRVSSRIQTRIVTFDALSVPITKGFTGVLHIGSMSEQVVVKKLISQLHRGTGEVVKARPRCLTKNVNGMIELEPSKPICVEEFKDVKELGRFTLRSAGVTIAAGVITKVY